MGMSSKEKIDYSKLNHGLWSKRKAISEEASQKIWDVFLRTNWFEKLRMNKTKNEKLNRFSSSIESASEWIKTKFVLTVNYLTKSGLVKDQIKSLNLRNLEDSTKTTDQKLENIIKELRSWLSDADKLKLDQNVSEWLLDLAKESESANELWEKIKELEAQNQDLQSELEATEAANEVAEKTVLSRRSTSNNIRIWNAIKKINEDDSLDAETKARKILWQANKYVFWWNKSRRKYFGSIQKMDVKNTYFNVVKHINESIWKASTREKVALRYIMRQINIAYENYIKASTIPLDDRKRNMKSVNDALASAA